MARDLRARDKGAKCSHRSETRVINGAHIVIYTKDPEADRAFFRNVLKFSAIDAGHNWLIFAMPPLEAAFHDSENNDQHELYLMCDDIAGTLERPWGKVATFTLPGGGRIGVYEPHPSPFKLKRAMARKATT